MASKIIRRYKVTDPHNKVFEAVVIERDDVGPDKLSVLSTRNSESLMPDPMFHWADLHAPHYEFYDWRVEEVNGGPDGSIAKQGEFYYLDESGQAQDAKLHNQILAEGDDRAVIEATRERMRRGGVSEEALDRIWPLPEQRKAARALGPAELYQQAGGRPALEARLRKQYPNLSEDDLQAMLNEIGA